ncbi:MAG: hypothetical protein PHZ00_03140 [Candidatus Peribacteraceae bacterium]|nr:hypothetical protein [Candidatus Peribacteraceae bacterium]
MTDDKSPLTKADGKKLEKKLERNICGLRKEMRASEDRILTHVDVLFESFRSDFLGAQSDRVTQHEHKIVEHGTRITRVEQFLHLAA